MSKLDKLRLDLEKVEITFVNAKKRKTLLADKVKQEEQKELQTMMNDMGITAAELKELIGGSPTPVSHSLATENDEGGKEC